MQESSRRESKSVPRTYLSSRRDRPVAKLAYNRRLMSKVHSKIRRKSERSLKAYLNQETKPITLNLETLLMLENAIEQVSLGKEPGDHWWKSVDSISSLQSLFRSEKVRKNMNLCLILCTVATTFGQTTKKLKKIAFNCHQSFLQYIQFVMTRIPSAVSNSIIHQLRDLYKSKTKSQSESILIMEKCNSIAVGRLSKLTDCLDDTSQLKLIARQIIENISLLSLSQAKELLRPIVKEDSELPEQSSKPYSLIIDVEGVLTNKKSSLRPYSKEFLFNIAKDYEIIALKSEKTLMLENENITHHLKREIKDISHLKRDLARVIIVVDDIDKFAMHPENGILIKRWADNSSDTALKELEEVLAQISHHEVEDTRLALAHFRDQMLAQSKDSGKIRLKLS